MNKLFLKLLLGLLPFIFVTVVYIFTDPFKVLYHYDTFFPPVGHFVISPDKDYVSTETFINNNAIYGYDSYIFGNSRSRNYPINEWRKHISSKASMHFDASKETLYGLEKKVQFLHRNGHKIKNALFVIDASVFTKIENDKTRNYRKHPQLSGESWLSFELLFFGDYLDLGFLKQYIPYVFTKKVTNSVENSIFDSAPYKYDKSTNEMVYYKYEEDILKNKYIYYRLPKVMEHFYNRDHLIKYSEPMIMEAQKKLLNNVAQILKEDQTQYRIVINPLYDQKKIDTTDLKCLQTIFGKENVFDFSGINEITNNIYNYYEESHYRPSVAKKIIDSIYSNK